MAQLVDKLLTCIGCGANFAFSADEQQFFQESGFAHDPKRCRACRAKRKSKPLKTRKDTKILCSLCGVETTVPFNPTQGRPVLCQLCYREERNKKP